MSNHHSEFPFRWFAWFWRSTTSVSRTTRKWAATKSVRSKKKNAVDKDLSSTPFLHTNLTVSSYSPTFFHFKPLKISLFCYYAPPLYTIALCALFSISSQLSIFQTILYCHFVTIKFVAACILNDLSIILSHPQRCPVSISMPFFFHISDIWI